MRGVTTGLMAVLLFAASCAGGQDPAPGAGTGESGGATSPVVADGDPTAQLCVRWAEFAELTEGNDEPDQAFVEDLLALMRDIDRVVVDELEPAWADIASWTTAFIEFFDAAGYQAVTEEVIVAAFGDAQAAEKASSAAETGYRTMRDWSGRNCEAGEGDAAAFCTSWTELAPLITRLDEEPPTKHLVEEAFGYIDDATLVVPADISEHWGAFLAYARPSREVLETVEYEPERITDELTIEAFGSTAEAASLEEASDAAVAAIDEWSLEGCGGFCARWGDTREAISRLVEPGWLVGVGQSEPAQLQTMQARIEVAARVVPPGIEREWQQLESLLNDWFDWLSSFDFDWRHSDSPEADQLARELAIRSPLFEEIAIEQSGVPEVDREPFLEQMWSESDSNIREHWTGVVPWAIEDRRQRIDAWAETGCAVEGGRPGQVRAQLPVITGAAGSTLILAVAPAGSTIDAMADPSDLLAGMCWEIGSDPAGGWIEYDEEGNEYEHRHETEGFPSERWGESLCDLRWEDGPARLEPGPYTMLAAVVSGAPSEAKLAAEPSACAAVDISVNGETLVPIPPLPPCEANLASLVVDPDPWRAPPTVDPSTPGAGVLRVTVPSFVLPDGLESGDGGELSIVVLPAGTTLNEVGREEVWPTGGFRTWLAPRDSAHGEELRALGEVDVPITAVPANGAIVGLEPHWLAEATPDQLPVTVLAPGRYDVRVQATSHSHESQDSLCGQMTVTIDGDTVVDMPELGECP